MDSEIFESLGAHPIQRGGTVYIPKDEALPCCLSLLSKNIRILGIDAFKLSKQEIEPFLKHSSDYSDQQPSENIIHDFFSKVPDTITHFEIVIDVDESI